MSRYIEYRECRKCLLLTAAELGLSFPLPMSSVSPTFKSLIIAYFSPVTITTGGNSISSMQYNYHWRKQEGKGTILSDFLWLPHPEHTPSHPLSTMLYIVFCATALVTGHNKAHFFIPLSSVIMEYKSQQSC